MKKPLLSLILIATVLLSACGSSTESIVSNETTTATTTESTTEVTTEASTTTSETTESTTIETFPEGGLQMSIEDVTQTIVDAMGSDYGIFTADTELWKWIRENNDGIVDYMACGRMFHSDEDEYDGYNGLIIGFNIFEFDMNSDVYKALCETNEFHYKWFIAGNGSPVEENATVTAINKQYVITVYASYTQWGGDLLNTYIPPAEEQPPFTLGKAQEGYEAFIALE